MTIPAAFIGHGSPMNTLESNRFTSDWTKFALSFAKPRAILAISAHWYINATAVTSMATPRVIHDFYGFPQELFDFDYPVAGSPDLARQVAQIVQPTWVGIDDETWGIDHGTWSVLAHMYPNADVPVVQLAIDASQPLQYHIDLGAQLAPLMDDDVLIVGSGNVVHNLRAVAWGAGDQGYDWAENFDRDATEIMQNRPEDFADLLTHDAYALAAPTPDHFLPLAYLAGLAQARGTDVDTFAQGCTLGSLSMTSYSVAAS
jgi:4,5-DOPA dioxygenase extradiol